MTSMAASASGSSFACGRLRAEWIARPSETAQTLIVDIDLARGEDEVRPFLVMRH